MQIMSCNRKNLCVDCDDQICLCAKKIISDCPKYICDRTGEAFEDCESCEFIKKYQEEMRNYYAEKD